MVVDDDTNGNENDGLKMVVEVGLVTGTIPAKIPTGSAMRS